MERVHTATIDTIEALRSALTKIERSLTVYELPEFASRLQLLASQWREYLTFDPHQFSYRTIYESPKFEINIISWRIGQFSSIHDHRGTACCVLVLDGVLTNIDYQLDAANELRETSRFDLRPGEMLSRNDWEIHRCGNGQPSGVDLATLHLYSPPLRPLEERQHHG
ncbi:cysteine dioxygenase [Gimesia sp.]|uniref:cysteine dioxygenase n=1 Tax=Gimesia sp. TaxID=2024833 RepID=UPI003A8DE503